MSCNRENRPIGGERYSPEKVSEAILSIAGLRGTMSDLEIARRFKKKLTDGEGGIETADALKYIKEEVWGAINDKDILYSEIAGPDLEDNSELADLLNLTNYRDKSGVFISESELRRMNSLRHEVRVKSETDGFVSENQINEWIDFANEIINRGTAEFDFEVLSEKAASKMVKDIKSPKTVIAAVSILISVKPDGLESPGQVGMINQALSTYVNFKKLSNSNINDINAIAIRIVDAIRAYEYHRTIKASDDNSEKIAVDIIETPIVLNANADPLSKQYAKMYNSITMEELLTLHPKNLNLMLLYANKANEFGGVPRKLMPIVHQAKTGYKVSKSIDFNQDKKTSLKIMLARLLKLKKDTGNRDVISLMDSTYEGWAVNQGAIPSISKSEFYDFVYIHGSETVKKALASKYSNEDKRQATLNGEAGAAAAIEYFREKHNHSDFNLLNEKAHEWLGSIELIAQSAAEGSIEGFELLESIGWYDAYNADVEEQTKINKFVKELSKKLDKVKIGKDSVYENSSALKFMALNFLDRTFLDVSDVIPFSIKKDRLLNELQRMETSDNEKIKKYKKAIPELVKLIKKSKNLNQFKKELGSDAVELWDYMKREAEVAQTRLHNEQLGTSKTVKSTKFDGIPLFSVAETDWKSTRRAKATGARAEDALVEFTMYNSGNYNDIKAFEASKAYGLNSDTVLDPDVLTNMIYFISKTRRQAASIRHIDRISGFINSPQYSAAAGKASSLKLLANRIGVYTDEITGGVVNFDAKTEYEKNRGKATKQFISELGAIGAAGALFKLKQPVAQTVPLAVQTSISSGQISPEVFANYIKEGTKGGWGAWAEEHGLSPAIFGAAAQGGELQSNMIAHSIEVGLLDASDIDNIAEKIATQSIHGLRKAVHFTATKVANKLLEISVAEPGKAQYLTDFVSYMKEYYKENNLKWNEKEILAGKFDRKATDWATSRVAKQQAPSNIHAGAKLYDPKSGALSQFIARFVFPYQTFSNYNRMNELSNILILSSKTASKDAKARARKELAGILAAQVTFHTIGHIFNEIIWVAAFLLMGYSQDEIDDILKERRRKGLQWAATSLVRDLTPIPGADAFTPRILNLALKAAIGEEYFKTKTLADEIGSFGTLGSFAGLLRNAMFGMANLAGYAVSDNYFTGEIDIYKVAPDDNVKIRLIGIPKVFNLPAPAVGDIVKGAREEEREIVKRARKYNK